MKKKTRDSAWHIKRALVTGLQDEDETRVETKDTLVHAEGFELGRYDIIE